MKVTKYPQSTLLVEKGKTRVLIDPGMFFFEKYSVSDFLDVDAVFYSHVHFDHLDQENAKVFARKNVPIYGNFDVSRLLNDLGIDAKEVFDRQMFAIGNLKIEPVFISHFKMADGSEGPTNTGYLIDGIFFHPGDGIEIDNFIVSKSAIPIAGPTVTYEKAWNFAKSLNCRGILPIHFDSPRFKADPKEFVSQKPGDLDIEVVTLGHGESAEF